MIIELTSWKNLQMYRYFMWHILCSSIVSATRCNTLQHTATHCNKLQHTTGCIDSSCGTPFAAAWCHNLLCHTPFWKTKFKSQLYSYFMWHALVSHRTWLQHTATHCNTLQHTATHCNTLQHTPWFLTGPPPQQSQSLCVWVLIKGVTLCFDVMLDMVALRCSMLQCVAVCCNRRIVSLQHIGGHALLRCHVCYGT